MGGAIGALRITLAVHETITAKNTTHTDGRREERKR
jgi:hypothetical protein